MLPAVPRLWRSGGSWVGATNPNMFLIRATINYPEGITDSWEFDLDDRDQRIDFARRADAALRLGATVMTKRAEAREGIER